MHVKKGDKVVVIAGSDKVRMVTKHQKATSQIQQAGILHQEGAINASNVMLYCDKCKSGVRTEIKIENGKKTRACKKCGSVL